MKNIFKNNNKVQSFDKYSRYSTTDVQFKTGLVKLSLFYSITNFRTKCLIALLMGLLMSIFTTFLVEITGLYSSGVTAFFQGIARMIYVTLTKNQTTDQYWTNVIYNLMFWGFYLVLNWYLFLRYSFKMNKQCIILSFVFVSTMQICGFSWSFIPQIHEIMIFGDTSTVNDVLKAYNVQCILYSPNWFPTFNAADHSYDWTHLVPIDDKDLTPGVISDVNNTNISRAFLLILYAVVYSLPSSYINSVLYIMGGSTGGTELTALYLSETKNKDVGSFLKVIQATTMFLGVMVGSYISGIIIDPAKYAGWQYLFNANLVASFIWVLLNSMLIGRFYPSRKLVRVEVFTSKLPDILNNLKKYQYTHPTTVVNSIGGYSANKNNILITVLPLTEIPIFIHVIRMIDTSCLISTTNINDCDGKVGLQKTALKSKTKK